MVEISMSGSGEGLGWATGPGYSTTILIHRDSIHHTGGDGKLRDGDRYGVPRTPLSP